MTRSKRSVGVTVLGILLLIPVPYTLIGFISGLRYFTFRELLPSYAGWFFLSVLFAIISGGILKRQHWAWVVCLWGSIGLMLVVWLCVLTPWNPLGVVGLGGLTYVIYPNGLGIPMIIFLTRPKVKAQFET